MLMRQAIRTVKSKEITLPAPIMGLNKKDPISAMAPLFAVEMDNYIPLDGKVELRPGYSLFAALETSGAPVKSMAAFKYPQHDKLFAFCDGKMWDVTHADSPEDMNISLSTTYCQTIQYKNYLYVVNGFDTPKVFYVDSNGDEHIGNWGFSNENLQDSRIINGAVSKEFLWFVEKGTLKAYYAASAGDVSGTLKSFDLAQVCKCGGELIAVANWTMDGGIGIDDLTVFITSEGEVFVYSGYNPNDATNWMLKGSYKLPKPVGYRCVLVYQGDLIIICEDGYFPLSKALIGANTGDSSMAFSDNIRGLMIERASCYRDKEGWQGIIYTKKGYGIFNVPVAEQFEQHVINVSTGAWCRFTNIRAFCWCMFNDAIYFGSDSAVYRFDDGLDDNGVAIEGVVEQAFNDFGTPSLKRFSLLSPRTSSSSPYYLSVYMNTDYHKRYVSYAMTVGFSSGVKWNSKLWSSSSNPIGTRWDISQTSKINAQWIMNSSVGVKASVVFKTKTQGVLIDWYDTGIRYELGTGIV